MNAKTQFQVGDKQNQRNFYLLDAYFLVCRATALKSVIMKSVQKTIPKNRHKLIKKIVKNMVKISVQKTARKEASKK